MRNDIVRIRAVWEVIKAANDRRRKLLDASRVLRTEVSKVANVVQIQTAFPSPIISLRAKDEDEMARLHRHLSSDGILAAPFFAPATALKFPVVRFTVHCDISPEDIAKITRSVAGFFAIAPKL
ncbi:hypothetical protein KXX44_008034 [Aspergillus fumigatus]|nr:hypothetical protein KXX44_008034 [Aspergillus fumigatus]KAH1839496.1 hypothetical protein KXX55_004996 [Aspergillus fumigatus]KAH3035779.1 hypothetical protein KXW01_005463 [Aspergillus fumigatus]KAH3313104.1 hypothetical protein KXW17_005864 [Aspergillus fumigatus]